VTTINNQKAYPFPWWFNPQMFYMYPNPVEDKLYIETDVEIEDVVVYDVYGRQQDNVAIRQHFVDVSDLTSGIYLVKIVTNDSGFIRRFVKN
jgi:hypothetical protein